MMVRSTTAMFVIVGLVLILSVEASLVMMGSVGGVRTMIPGETTGTAAGSTALPGGSVSTFSLSEAGLGLLGKPGAATGNGGLFLPAPVDNVVYSVQVSTNAGQYALTAVAGVKGSAGTATGTPTGTARLNAPIAVAVANDGSVFIADYANNNIRKLDAGRTSLSVHAGSSVGTAGHANGAGASALFCGPRGMVISHQPTQLLYVADTCGYRIRVVTVDTGAVSDLAGDGIKGVGASSFYGPLDIVLSSDESTLYVADTNSVRSIVLSNAGTIGRLAGDVTLRAYNGDGAGASTFMRPVAISVDKTTNGDVVLVAEQCNAGSIIRKIASDGAVTLQSGDSVAAGCGPRTGSTTTPVVHYLDENGPVFYKNKTTTRVATVADLIAPDEEKPLYIAGGGWKIDSSTPVDKVNWYFQIGDSVSFPLGLDASGKTFGDQNGMSLTVQGIVQNCFLRFYSPLSAVPADNAGWWYEASFQVPSSSLGFPGTFSTPYTKTITDLASSLSPVTNGNGGSISKKSWAASANEPISVLSFQTSSDNTNNDFTLERISFSYTDDEAVFDLTDEAKATGSANAGTVTYDNANYVSMLGMGAVQFVCGQFYDPSVTSITISSSCTVDDLASVSSLVISAATTLTTDFQAESVSLGDAPAALTFTGPSQIAIGTLSISGSGTLSLSNNGGTIGTLTLGSNAVLAVNFGDASFSVPVVTAQLNMDGTLNIVLRSFTPAQGTRLRILGLIASSGVAGSFANVNLQSTSTRSARHVLASSQVTFACSAAEGGCFATIGSTPDSDGSDDMPLIVALVVIGLFVLGAMVGAAFYYRHKSSKADEESRVTTRPRPSRRDYVAGRPSGSFAGVDAADEADPLSSSRHTTYGTEAMTTDADATSFSSSPSETSRSSSLDS